MQKHVTMWRPVRLVLSDTLTLDLGIGYSKLCVLTQNLATQENSIYLAAPVQV
jgi:hypothetical protein